MSTFNSRISFIVSCAILASPMLGSAQMESMTYSAFEHVVKMHAKTIQVSRQQRRDIDELNVTLIRQLQALSDTLPEEGTGGGSFVDGVFVPDDKAAAELFATYVQAETQVYQVALEQFEESLTAKQMVRVREIALQRAYDSGGLYEALKSIYLQPKLAELQVTPLQLADIKEILQSPDPANWEKRILVDQERNLRKRQLTEDLESQVYAKLTDQQRRLLKELLGPPLVKTKSQIIFSISMPFRRVAISQPLANRHWR